MIVSKSTKRGKNQKAIDKSMAAVKKIFVEADANADGMLDKGEWIIFSAKMAESLKAKYGGAYTLTED